MSVFELLAAHGLLNRAGLTLLSEIVSFSVSFWLPLREVWAGEIDE